LAMLGYQQSPQAGLQTANGVSYNNLLDHLENHLPLERRSESAEGVLSSQIDLNRTIVDTIRTSSNGVEQVQEVPHRLGDYFVAVRVLP
ncbi:MAG: hypothetical protein ACREJM_05665, partial [Candidatus Saccharimonadales bacterium]